MLRDNARGACNAAHPFKPGRFDGSITVRLAVNMDGVEVRVVAT